MYLIRAIKDVMIVNQIGFHEKKTEKEIRSHIF